MTDTKKCFVLSCGNTTINSKKIFATVPRNADIRKQWCMAVGRLDILKTASRGIFCCEDHFNMENDSENWMEYKLLAGKLRMKKDVVPHKNLTEKSNIPREYSQLTNSTKKRKQENILEVSARKIPKLSGPRAALLPQALPDYERPSTSFRSQVMAHEDLLTAEDPSTLFSVATPTKSVNSTFAKSPSGIFFEEKIEDIGNLYFHTKEKHFINKGTQVNIRKKTKNACTNTYERTAFVSKKTIVHFKRDLSSSSLTSSAKETTVSERESSSDFEYPKHKLKIYNSEHTRITISSNSRFYLGLPQDTYFLIELLEKESCVSHTNIFVILKKIRLNDAYYRLAIDFGMSVGNISKIINQYLPILASYLKKLIVWPPARDIKLNLPIPFRMRYNKVQSIIDCLEIEIEKPTKPLHQSLTWSEYKKANTLKYLISATPDGIINFISPGFGGRITDTDIVEQSGYLDILPENSDVMADRGFKNIAAMLQRKSCKLIRPASVSANKQSTKEQVKESKRIASLRIHIERVIRRLREFSMLQPHACIDNKLVSKTDNVIIVACGIVNLQGPLIK